MRRSTPGDQNVGLRERREVVRVDGRRFGFWYGLAILAIRPPLRLLTRRRWVGVENLPATGGMILVPNHLSHADSLTLAHCLVDHGRRPRFLAKAELFRVPVVGAVMRGAGQIPVYRDTAVAGAALVDAVEELRRGECVVVYPEGTTSRDPDRWPMHARTGVARLALETDCPVLPVAMWGAQRLYDKGSGGWHLRRAEVTTWIGPPVDLSAYRGRPATPQMHRQVTDQIMRQVTLMLGELRGQTPPDVPYATPGSATGDAVAWRRRRPSRGVEQPAGRLRHDGEQRAARPPRDGEQRARRSA